MRVFITGATGFIGKQVVQEFLRNGHQILGLARSDKSAEILTALGAEVARGSLTDADSLKRGASASDGVVHLAFNHDFSDYADACELDRTVIEAIGETLAGTRRPFIVTSGTLLLPHGRLVTEDEHYDASAAFGAERGKSEDLTLSLVSKGVSVMVMRLAPTNHGRGDAMFIPMLISPARKNGFSAYIDDGRNRWPSTHVLDAAKAYYLAFTKGSAGSIYHATAEEGVPMKDVAEAIGRKLNVPTVSLDNEDAVAKLGFIAIPLAQDNPTSSAKTREALGWDPTQPSLLSDLQEDFYYE